MKMLSIQNNSRFRLQHQALPEITSMNSLSKLLVIVMTLINIAPSCHGSDGRSELPDPSRPGTAVDPSAFRVLFVGNSITRHGFNSTTVEKLKWNHVAGMAASSEEKDYAHTFAGLIQTALPSRKLVLSFASLVPGGDGTSEERLAPVNSHAAEPSDLVIIQFGEHEKQARGIDAMKETYEKLVSLFLASPSKPMIICVGNWVPGSGGIGYTEWGQMVQDAMRQICGKHGLPFVSVEEIAMDPANRGWGEHPGVQWHPNDRGHQLYARKISEAYKIEASKQ